MGDVMAGKTFRRSAEVAPVFFQVELDDGKLLRFDCRRSVPGGVALAFADAGGLDEDASESQRGSAAIRATKALFEAAIVPDQQAKFWAMVNGQDPDGLIDLPTMSEIAYWLGEAYTERPTGQSSADGSPGTNGGSHSTDGAAPEASTYSRSQPSALGM
jgi:hypothetical protein